MPFIIGYFGKNASLYTQKIESLVGENAVKESINKINNENLIVLSGILKRETHCSDSIIPLASDAGIIVGKLFTKETYESIVSFDNEKSREFVRNPELLMKNYWGRYAAVLYDNDSKAITLVREPIGLSTLFYMQLPDGILFATDISLLYDYLDHKPSVNWNYFADYVIGSQTAPALTPFNDILELQPGMRLHYNFNGTAKKELLWDISSIKSTPVTDPAALEKKLTHTLKACTKAWIKDSKGVCVELSGGADSTAVTILAREAINSNQKLIAVNYIDSKQPSSNEIEHAQEVATLCDAELFFPDWQDTHILEPSKNNWRPNRPNSRSLFTTIDAITTDIVQSQSCTEIINGQGGDHVFLAPPLEYSLADYWLEKGIRGSMNLANDIAGHYRMPVFSLLWKNIKEVIFHLIGKKRIEQGYNDWMPESILKRQTEKEHYLNDFLSTQSPGKKQHMRALAHAMIFAEGYQRSSHWIKTHPLLSQPIVELGLQIPTYQTFGEGFDRIFFRKAVSKIKKPKALWRHLKGHTTNSMINALAHNADAIEDMLVNGSLMKEGLIEKEWLEKNMTQIRHGSIENSWPIVNLISAQQWLDQWGL